jgi:hypothetical protein
MRRLAYLIPGFVLLGLVTFTPGTQAESECDGETGAALGLCKAYCEALECDTAAPIGSLKACERILSTLPPGDGDPSALPHLHHERPHRVFEHPLFLRIGLYPLLRRRVRVWM